jgi:Fe-S-cluster containining protein
VTSIELAALRRAIDARGGARSWKKAKDANGRARLPVADERACPLLDATGRCAVYAARPLGCRTFYCERADVIEPLAQRELNALVRRIQDIAARHEPNGDRGRPLTKAL